MKRIFVLFLSLFFVNLMLGQAGRVKQLDAAIDKGRVSTLTTTITSNYTASTDSTNTIITSITESNDIVVNLPTPSANTVGLNYTVNQIDRNNDGLGFTLVQVDGLNHDFYYSGDTLQFVAFTPDLDENFSFQTIFLDGAYRWLGTKLISQKNFEVDSVSQITGKTFPIDARILSKGLDGKGEAIFNVLASGVAGYTTDSLAVIPVAKSYYAVLQPNATKQVKSSSFDHRLNSAINFVEQLDYELVINDSLAASTDITVIDAQVKVLKGGLIHPNGNTITWGNPAIDSKTNLTAGNYRIFGDTVGQIFKANNILEVNVQWWGAIPDLNLPAYADTIIDYSGFTDNSPYFAAANNSLQFASPAMTIYVPSGQLYHSYRITRPIILGGDNTFFGTVNMRGDPNGRGFATTSIIFADFRNGSAIGIDGQRGCFIKNMSIVGRNQTHIRNLTIPIEYHLQEDYYNGFGAPSDGQNAYSGIGIDVTSTLIRKTSDVIIQDCRIQGFNVGVFVSQAGLQQGDLTSINDCYLSFNTVGVAIGDDQSRSVEINRTSLTFGHTAYTNKALSLQGESFPIINGGWAISHENIFNANTNTCGNSYVRSLYAEDVGRIGNFRATNAIECAEIGFVDCHFLTIKNGVWADSTQVPDLETDVNLRFIGGSIRSSRSDYFIIKQNSEKRVLFDGVTFEFKGDRELRFITNDPTRLLFKNSQVSLTSPDKAYIGLEEYIFSPEINGDPKLQDIWVPTHQSHYIIKPSVLTASFASPNFNTGNVTYEPEIYSNTRIGLFANSAQWVSLRQLKIALADNINAPGRLFEGDIISATHDSELKYFVVDSIYNISNSEYRLNSLFSNPDTTVLPTQTYVFEIPTIIPTGLNECYGKTVSGTSFISGITDTLQFKQGDWIFGAGVSDGFTRVDSVSSDTIYLTRDASVTLDSAYYYKHVRFSKRTTSDVDINYLAKGGDRKGELDNSLISQPNDSTIEFTNNTPALNGSQSQSPTTQKIGQGYATTPSESQKVEIRDFVLPIQGSTSPSLNYKIQARINEGTWMDAAQIINTGVANSTNNQFRLTDGVFNLAWNGSYQPKLWFGDAGRSITTNGAGSISITGNLAIGVSTPSSILELAAGNSARAPLELNSGPLITTPIPGSVEFLDDELFFTVNTGNERKKIAFDDIINPFGGTNTIQGGLDSLALTYSLFPAITYTPTDSIPIDTTLNSFPITTRLDGDTLRQITYSVTKAPTINLDLQVLIWDGSSYTAAFSATIPAGQRSVTVSGAVAVATDERIFPEILTDSGASGLDLELKFQKP